MIDDNNRPNNAPQPSLNQANYGQFMVYHASRATRPEPSRKPKRRLLSPKLRLLIIVLILAGVSGHIVWSKHVSAETLAQHKAQVLAAQETQHKASLFASQLQTLLSANPGDSISVATAASSQGLQTYGDTGVFDGASTAKLLSAADLLHHVELGTANLGQQLDGQTLGSWLQTMIVNSDDTAWSELNGFLTHDDLAAYAGSINFNNYDPSTNTFTAGDTALLLQKLYNGELLKPSNRALLLKYLGEANYREYIVAAVPSGDGVYHKVGLDDDTINDAAIITHNNQYLVLVIFSDGNGSYDWPNRTQLIHSITQDAVAAYL